MLEQEGEATPLKLLPRDDPACLGGGVANRPLLARGQGHIVNLALTEAGLFIRVYVHGQIPCSGFPQLAPHTYHEHTRTVHFVFNLD